MAYTSIWRIKGWLGKSLIYIENPEKTTNPLFYSKIADDKQRENLQDVIAYAVNQNKTSRVNEETEIMEKFVSGINCFPATARTEMLAVKKHYGKEDGTIAYHGIQSFAPGEASPYLVHQIGIELAKRLWGDKYQVVVATHLDKENHLHNHFVVNTVSYIDGTKYHRTKADYQEMRRISDELCREYGLSTIDNPNPMKGKHYGEVVAEQQGCPTWRGFIKEDIDQAIRTSMTERQFYGQLRSMGYEVKTGKYLYVKPQGKERFVRLSRQLGEDYTIESIRNRILRQQQSAPPMQEPQPRRYNGKMKGSYKKTKKATGLRALYLHYCYLLGVFPKKKQQSRKRMHFLLKEDLLKLDQITKEAQLLGAHRIDTAEQLSSYRTDVEGRIALLTAQRKELYRKQRSADVKNSADLTDEVKAEIAVKTAELKRMRREVKLCEGIANRSEVIKERIQTVHDEEMKRREENQHEQFRGRSRANR